MMRYFIGLMVPPPVQNHLTEFAATIQRALPAELAHKISWTHPADLHCTLLFVGNYDDEHHLIARMTDLAAHLPPATLNLTGQTHVLGRNSLALAVTGAEQLGTAFVEQLGSLSSNPTAGTRPFYGHVTIGRLRSIPSRSVEVFTGHEVEPMSWPATTVQLFQSLAQPTDRRYRVVANAHLGAGLD